MITGQESDVEVGTSPPKPEPRHRRSWKRKLLWSLAGFVGVFVFLVAAIVAYFVYREHVSPSGKVYVKTSQGKVELHVPAAMAVAPTIAPSAVVPNDPSPPTTIEIRSIGLHASVYLMTSEAPKGKVVGWIYGTAMPGTNGNMVFYGARGGPNAVFENLGDLHKGDQITVSTGSATYVYAAVSEREVAASDTSILLPTSQPTLTLITDAGQWDQNTGQYTRRLVVQATYQSVRP